MHTQETKTSFQEIIKEKFVVFTSLSFYLSRSTILSLYILPLRIFYSADKLRKFVEVMAHKKVFFFYRCLFCFCGWTFSLQLIFMLSYLPISNRTWFNFLPVSIQSISLIVVLFKFSLLFIFSPFNTSGPPFMTECWWNDEVRRRWGEVRSAQV